MSLLSDEKKSIKLCDWEMKSYHFQLINKAAPQSFSVLDYFVEPY